MSNSNNAAVNQELMNLYNISEHQDEFSEIIEKLRTPLYEGDYEDKYLSELVKSTEDYIFDSSVSEIPADLPEETHNILTELKKYVEENNQYIEYLRESFDGFVHDLADPIYNTAGNYHPNSGGGRRRRRRRATKKKAKARKSRKSRKASKSRKSRK